MPDMFHLADDNYPVYAERLRKEWELILGRHYSDEQWHHTNLTQFKKHTYFTDYGKTVLQENKFANVHKLLG